MKQIKTLYHWVGILMHIKVQTRYDSQYITTILSGYINSPTEPTLLSLRYGMEYLVHHPHEPIMYSRKKALIINDITHQYFFKADSAETNKNHEY